MDEGCNLVQFNGDHYMFETFWVERLVRGDPRTSNGLVINVNGPAAQVLIGVYRIYKCGNLL